MCGFSYLDYGSDNTLEKRKYRIHCMLDDSLILERDEENIYSRIDPMLDEESLCLQVDHDIKCHT